MNFGEALSYLNSFTAFEDLKGFREGAKKFNLRGISEFLRLYGVDYSKIKFIHVAGSKGKGITAKLFSDYLVGIGYKTGLMLSPYFFDLRDYFQIDGENIDEEEFCSYVADLKDFFAVRSLPFSLSRFEVCTALVLKYFADKGVDYAVIEAGMGGRSDATNVISPELCVLTLVEKEHTDVFGSSYSDILNEKLGIYKGGCKFVIAEQCVTVECLIRNYSRFCDDFCFVSDDDRDRDFFERRVGVSLVSNLLFERGKGFLQNAKTVLLGLELLFRDVNVDVFLNVLNDFNMFGRFDVRSIKGKTVIFDIAHTVSSMRNLIDALKRKFKGRKFVFLISMMRGKEIDSVFSLFGKEDYEVVFTTSSAERGYFADELFLRCARFCKNARTGSTALKDFENLLFNMKNDEILIVTGSHFLVKEILRTL